MHVSAAPVEPATPGTWLDRDARMSKHKSGSASPGVHREERAGGAVRTSPTTELAELDAGPVVENPATESSGQREGIHEHPAIGPRKPRNKG